MNRRINKLSRFWVGDLLNEIDGHVADHNGVSVQLDDRLWAEVCGCDPRTVRNWRERITAADSHALALIISDGPLAVVEMIFARQRAMRPEATASSTVADAISESLDVTDAAARLQRVTIEAVADGQITEAEQTRIEEARASLVKEVSEHEQATKRPHVNGRRMSIA